MRTHLSQIARRLGAKLRPGSALISSPLEKAARDHSGGEFRYPPRPVGAQLPRSKNEATPLVLALLFASITGAALGDLLRLLSGPVVVAGDFNQPFPRPLRVHAVLMQAFDGFEVASAGRTGAVP